MRALSALIARVADWTNIVVGHPIACALVSLLVVVDLAVGIQSNLGGTWGNINGAFTGIVGVELLFFLQHSENEADRSREQQDRQRDLQNAALHVKLDALIASLDQANNKAIGLETETEQTIVEIRDEIVESVAPPGAFDAN